MIQPPRKAFDVWGPNPNFTGVMGSFTGVTLFILDLQLPENSGTMTDMLHRAPAHSSFDAKAFRPNSQRGGNLWSRLDGREA
jgi:hypothetical protein